MGKRDDDILKGVHTALCSDVEKLRNFPIVVRALQQWMSSGCVYMHTFYSDIESQSYICEYISVCKGVLYSYRRGLRVACSTTMGNAKASQRGTATMTVPRFFIFVV